MPATARLKKAKGNYYARFYDPERKPKDKTYPLRTTRKDVAEKRLRKLLRRVDDEGFDPWQPDQPAGTEHVSFSEAASRFLDSRRHLQPATQRAYGIAMRGLEKLLPPGLPLALLSTQHLRAYIEDDDVSVSTRHHRRRHVRAFLRWLEEESYLRSGHDLLKGVRLPKQDRTLARFLQPEDVERVLRAIDAHTEIQLAGGHAREGENVWLKDVVLVAVNTGLRLGELCAMRWNWIDLTEQVLVVKHSKDFKTKGNAERVVPLVGEALTVIERLHAQREPGAEGRLDEREPVLRNAAGAALNASYTSKRFKFFCRKAKLPEEVHFHTLRHTTASWLVQRAVPLSIVQAILGHSSITVTERYAHLAPDVVRTAMQQALGRGAPGAVEVRRT